MIDLIGDFGVLCFSLCGIPQAIQCYKQKHSEGISVGYLGLWLAGELAMIVHAIGLPLPNIILTNYVANLVCLLVIIYYKVKGNKNGKI